MSCQTTYLKRLYRAGSLSLICCISFCILVYDKCIYSYASKAHSLLFDYSDLIFL